MAEKLEKPPESLPQGVQSETTYKTSDPHPHYLELDALRGIAILSVVASHIAGNWFVGTGKLLDVPLLGVDLLDLLALGYLGVPLFFLLSGYLLTWTEEGRRRRGSYSILSYAKRRALRLVPAYYAAIAAVILVAILMQIQPSFGVVALHLTFLQGFVPSYPMGLDLAWWSLTPEVVFYALLPFLVLKFRKFSQRVVIFAVLVVVSLATRLLQTHNFFGLLTLPNDNFFGLDRIYYFPTTTLYLFLVGMLLRMMVDRRIQVGHQPNRRQLFVASALSVVSVAVLLVFPYLVMDRSESLHHPMGSLAEAMVVLGFASALLGSPLLKPVLAFRPLVFLGKISYSLFLLQSTIIGIVAYYTQNMVYALVAYQSALTVLGTFAAYAFAILAVCSALAYLSYRYVESPFLRYKPK